jgi:hypothetical protein
MQRTTRAVLSFGFVALLAGAGGCTVDDSADEIRADVDAESLQDETPYYGCWLYGSWSGYNISTTYFKGASRYSDRYGREQQVKRRSDHPYSADSYTSNLFGAVEASSWRVEATCSNGTTGAATAWATISTFSNPTTNCYPATTSSVRVQVRAASC